MVSSVRSVATPEDFFGTKSIPFPRSERFRGPFHLSLQLNVRPGKDVNEVERRGKVFADAAFRKRLFQVGADLARHTDQHDTIAVFECRNFFGNGVPEYTGMSSGSLLIKLEARSPLAFRREVSPCVYEREMPSAGARKFRSCGSARRRRNRLAVVIAY